MLFRSTSISSVFSIKGSGITSASGDMQNCGIVVNFSEALEALNSDLTMEVSIRKALPFRLMVEVLVLKAFTIDFEVSM